MTDANTTFGKRLLTPLDYNPNASKKTSSSPQHTTTCTKAPASKTQSPFLNTIASHPLAFEWSILSLFGIIAILFIIALFTANKHPKVTKVLHIIAFSLGFLLLFLLLFSTTLLLLATLPTA